jgi:hypothetical protein
MMTGQSPISELEFSILWKFGLFVLELLNPKSTRQAPYMSISSSSTANVVGADRVGFNEKCFPDAARVFLMQQFPEMRWTSDKERMCLDDLVAEMLACSDEKREFVSNRMLEFQAEEVERKRKFDAERTDANVKRLRELKHEIELERIKEQHWLSRIDDIHRANEEAEAKHKLDLERIKRDGNIELERINREGKKNAEMMEAKRKVDLERINREGKEANHKLDLERIKLQGKLDLERKKNAEMMEAKHKLDLERINRATADRQREISAEQGGLKRIRNAIIRYKPY